MKTILIVFIKLYRRILSPILPGACRFTPTCSEYAIQALTRFGAIRGSLLMVWRILRCNPFCRGGYDPVPERFTFKRQGLNKTNENEPVEAENDVDTGDPN
jgi:putative membrane protein insertion efficiency factor